MDINNFSDKLTLQSNNIWSTSDRRSVSYPTDGNKEYFKIEDGSFWFRHRNEIIAFLVNRHSPTKPIFDIGGGNGCVSNHLQSVGIDVALVEPGASGTLNARARGVRTIVQSTLEDAGFFSNSIPAIGLFDVIEHIEDDLAFLCSIYDYLEPGGVLYLTVPSYRTLWSNDDVLAGHFRRYSINSLKGSLASVGFHNIYSSYIFSLLIPPIFALRTLPSLFRIAKRKKTCSADIKNAHCVQNRIISEALKLYLKKESDLIKLGKKIPCGSSCIAVAKKPRGKR